MNVILKTRYIFHCPQPQYPDCVHAGFCSLAAARPQRRRAMPFLQRKTEKVWRKTRLLTNDGMLKILCLDVEELFDSTCSNSLNDVFANSKRRSKCP